MKRTRPWMESGFGELVGMNKPIRREMRSQELLPMKTSRSRSLIRSSPRIQLPQTSPIRASPIRSAPKSRSRSPIRSPPRARSPINVDKIPITKLQLTPSPKKIVPRSRSPQRTFVQRVKKFFGFKEKKRSSSRARSPSPKPRRFTSRVRSGYQKFKRSLGFQG